MKNLLLRTGGRPFAYDDLEILQALALAGTELAPWGNCVLSGCQLTPTPGGTTYDVNAGVLWLEGERRDFPGRVGVTLPALFEVGAEVKSDNRVHVLSSQSLPCVREQNAELVDYNPASPPARLPLLLTANGPLTLAHRLREQVRSLGEVQYVATDDAAHYDADGRGVGPAWGWALCDGRGGRARLGGQFVVGRDASRADYDTVGKTGGQAAVTLQTAQLPAHSHGSNNRITDTRLGGEAAFTAAWTSAPGAAGRNLSTTETGGGQPHENRPPYTVLLARQWVGYEQ